MKNTMAPAPTASVATSLFTRCICWAAVTCTTLLCTKDVQGQITDAAGWLAYSLAIEILSIAVFYRLFNNKIARDMIDLSLYVVLFKLVILEAFFFNRPLFLFICDFVYLPFMSGMFLLAMIRLFWFEFHNGKLLFGDWPVFGLVGLHTQAWEQTTIQPIYKWRFFVMLIVVAEISLLVTAVKFGWDKILLSGIGLGFILVFSKKVQSSIVTTLNEQADQARTIADLEAVIERAAAAIATLRPAQPSRVANSDNRATANVLDFRKGPRKD